MSSEREPRLEKVIQVFVHFDLFYPLLTDRATIQSLKDKQIGRVAHQWWPRSARCDPLICPAAAHFQFDGSCQLSFPFPVMAFVYVYVRNRFVTDQKRSERREIRR